jgi:GNAT superfamily N-acetyltransferase
MLDCCAAQYRNVIMQDHPLRRWLKSLYARKGGQTVLVKALRERDRRRVLRHFMALDRDDRLLRFGSVLPDEQVGAYIAKLDFARDIVFGVYDRVFRLVGVGHLAFTSRAAHPDSIHDTDKEKVAEFGVSVSRSARGQGVGTRLFERAAIHCRNADVDTLYMQCLSSNRTMMHIAKKAGMEIRRDYGEADAHLHLPPPSPGSVLAEALEEQIAKIDYTVKANARAVAKWLMWRR